MTMVPSSFAAFISFNTKKKNNNKSLMNVFGLIQLRRYTFNNHCYLDQKIHFLEKTDESNNFNLIAKFFKPFFPKRKNLPQVNKSWLD